MCLVCDHRLSNGLFPEANPYSSSAQTSPPPSRFRLGPSPYLESHDRASRMLTETTQHRWLVQVEPRACAGPTSNRVSAQMVWYNRQMIWCDRSSLGCLKPIGKTESNLRQISIFLFVYLGKNPSPPREIMFVFPGGVGGPLLRLVRRWVRTGRRGQCSLHTLPSNSWKMLT